MSGRLPWVDLEGHRLNDEVYAFLFYDQSRTIPRVPEDFPQGTVFYFRARNPGRYPGRPDSGAGGQADLAKRSDDESGSLEWARENRTLYLWISAEDTRSAGRDESWEWELDATVPGRGRQTLARGSLAIHNTSALNDEDIVSAQTKAEL